MSKTIIDEPSSSITAREGPEEFIDGEFEEFEGEGEEDKEKPISYYYPGDSQGFTPPLRWNDKEWNITNHRTQKVGFKVVKARDPNGKVTTTEVPANVTICPSPIIITKILRNIETNVHMVEITFWKDKGKTESKLIMPLSEILNKRGVMRLANVGLNITDAKAPLLVDYFSHLLEWNEDKIPHEEQYNTMGWKDNFKTFILGRIKITSDSSSVSTVSFSDSIESEYVDAISAKGDIKAWLSGTRKLLKYPLVRFNCYVGMSSILMMPLEQPTRAFNFWNPLSSCGKTTSVQVGTGMFGNPEKLCYSAKDTMNNKEAVLNLYKHLPVHFDEVQLISPDPEVRKDQIYTIGNEEGKGRLSKNLEITKKFRWRTTVFLTGEVPIVKDESHQGEQVRAIDISNAGFKRDVDAVNEFEAIKNNNYGFFGRDFIKSIMPLIESGDLKKGYEKCLAEIKNVNSDKANNIVDRMSNTFAVVLLAGRYFENIMKLEGEAVSDPLEIVSSVMREYIMEISSSTYGIKALKDIYSWIDANLDMFRIEGRFVTDYPPKQAYGSYEDGRYIHVYITSIKNELKRLGYNASAVRNDWTNTKILISSDERLSMNRYQGRAWIIDTTAVHIQTGLTNPFFNVIKAQGFHRKSDGYPEQDMPSNEEPKNLESRVLKIDMDNNNKVTCGKQLAGVQQDVSFR
jgi:uncharacterized protein (DUF927 family)